MKLAVAIMLCAVGLAAAQPRGPKPPPLPPMPEEPEMQAAVSEKMDCGLCRFYSDAYDICVPVPARFKCSGPVGGASGKQCSACQYAEQDGDADHCVSIPGDVCRSSEFAPPAPAPAPGAAAPAPVMAAPAPTAGLPRTANGEVLGATRPSAAGAGDVPTAAEVAAMQAAEDTDAPEAPRPVAPRAKGPHPPPPRH